MCGIAGFIDLSASTPIDELQHAARGMAAALRHRGPDDEGEWCEADSGVALASRRLAIIDLSPHGHQPLESSCGRYVLAFNGEIYNFRDLRRDLERCGRVFRGSSDTEVLAEAIGEWGFTAALRKSNGMFGLAVWDRRHRKLMLARDRMGEKPLYYGRTGRHFFFASETGALRAHPAFNATIDPGAVSLFIRHNYIPAPWSIYQGIKKLPAGTYVVIDWRNTGEPSPVPYWSLRDAVETGVRSPLEVTPAEAVQELDVLLRDSVSLRMIADVPLGAFLSGGIDSSTVIALMQEASPRPVRTFTVGFHDEVHDEAASARAVADHLGTDHSELYVDEQELLSHVPRMASVYDEPFGDSSQIPTFLIAKLARGEVTVALSGDGGDELFGGYPRYEFADRYWGKMRLLPPRARAGVARGIKRVPVERWSALLGVLNGRVTSRPGDKLHKFADVLGATSDREMVTRLHSFWDPSPPVYAAADPPSPFAEPGAWAEVPSLVEQMMLLDSSIYLPDDILTKVDRATMAVSLETRIPLLDHRVVEFAWRLPLRWKVKGTSTKSILRHVLHGYVPQALVERPKMGFGVPLAAWLRGPLRDWAEDLLATDRLADSGLLDPEPIRSKWSEHLSARRDWKYDLWGVLMLQAWFQETRGRAQSEVA